MLSGEKSAWFARWPKQKAHTAYINKLNLFFSVLHKWCIVLTYFDGPIHYKGFTTIIQGHPYQYDQLTLGSLSNTQRFWWTSTGRGIFASLGSGNRFILNSRVNRLFERKPSRQIKGRVQGWRQLLLFFIYNVKLKIIYYELSMIFPVLFTGNKQFQLFQFFVESFRRMSVWRCNLRWLQWGNAKEVFKHALDIGV